MFFLARFSKKLGKNIDVVPQGIMDFLSTYTWPGNIRELQNLIERAVLLSQGPVLRLDRTLLPATAADAGAMISTGVEDAPQTPDPDDGRRRVSVSPASGEALGEALTLEAVEKHHILAVLTQTGWVIEGPKGAATLLKLHPNTLRSRMKKLGIQRPAHDIS
jgi:formate hydrogenlyase transcriptional activator